MGKIPTRYSPWCLRCWYSPWCLRFWKERKLNNKSFIVDMFQFEKSIKIHHSVQNVYPSLDTNYHLFLISLTNCVCTQIQLFKKDLQSKHIFFFKILRNV